MVADLSVYSAAMRLFALGLLARPHLGVEPVAAQQFGVGAALDDAAGVEHDDLVGVDDRSRGGGR